MVESGIRKRETETDRETESVINERRLEISLASYCVEDIFCVYRHLVATKDSSYECNMLECVICRR